MATYSGNIFLPVFTYLVLIVVKLRFHVMELFVCKKMLCNEAVDQLFAFFYRDWGKFHFHYLL